MEGNAHFDELRSAVAEGVSPILLTGVSAVHKAHFSLGLYWEGKTCLIITGDEPEARRIAGDINEMAGESCCVAYPAKDFAFSRVETASREYEHMRLSVLSKLCGGAARLVCASVESLLQATIPPDTLKENEITLSREGTVNTQALTARLVKAGYTRRGQVDGAAQFSVRGAIIDIFPVNEPNPVRIELWGDEIESISAFDIETQRRGAKMRSVKISPALETLFESDAEFIKRLKDFSDTVQGKKAQLIKEGLETDIECLKAGVIPGNIDKYLPLAYEKPAFLFDYLSDGAVTVFSEIANIEEIAKGVLNRHYEDVKLLLENGELCRGLDGHMTDFEALTQMASDNLIYMDTFIRGLGGRRYKKIISATANQTSAWGGEIRQLSEDIKSFLNQGYSVAITAGTEKTVPILADDLREEGIPCDISGELTKGRATLVPGALSAGYDYPNAKTALITRARIQATKRNFKKSKKKGEEINSLADMRTGDLVVHALHGIGRFIGIRKLELEGVIKDYITIQYDGTDVLYVPVNQLDLVSRYIGPRDTTGVKLNKLSSDSWQKARSKVKKAVRDMAGELIRLYAARSQTKGHAFSEDDDFQLDFEERFPYSETDDQLVCAQEIKTDMQKDIPMDRLLCGDVGFGKTEVAFRAAFKCVEDGFQCAILAPTTVLSWQHYQTAVQRFEHFPIKIELLSRFRTKKQQNEILKRLKRGEIDMIIGTHRLVQKDIAFHKLGLVIIDEEQRFGVAHKERFKEMFTGVDVLTLSATPIPRTLNMAMSGIRDMSVIEEPPVDRYPVQTYVVEQDMGMIIQAITKELRRGGQVYYIHNRVETIEICAAKLRQRLPDARIGVAHGQLSENALSDIWKALLEREIDVLVCTTIIETGVDVSNVNTLIIEDSDNLGLSQLYQLRGRVGRSNRRAFAYFTFKRGKVLTEISSKRLEAIREFTQFGSGFRIALRDLEIRGAGSILGGRQHGHMEAVGYDMYLKLLSEAIAEQKGEAPPNSMEECLIDLHIDAHIPEDYIENLALRLDAYRKIACVRSKEDEEDLSAELTDRYGFPPESVCGLMRVALFRNMAGSIGVTEITQKNGVMMFYIKSIGMDRIQALVSSFKGRVTVNGSAKPFIAVKMREGDSPAELMRAVVETLCENTA